MPYDANGNYTLPPGYKAVTGTIIDVTQHNPPFEDVQAALGMALLRDGRAGWTGNQNANGNKLTNLLAGTALSDAVTVQQMQGYVSGTLGMGPGDHQGLGLHFTSDGTPVGAYNDSSGTTQFPFMATQSWTAGQVANEATTRANADAQLVSGTYGTVTANGDKKGTGLHLNGGSGRASFVYAGGSGDLAWYTDVQVIQTNLNNEAATRANADAQLVSGTYGTVTANGDKKGTGLHLNGGSGRASFVYAGGSGDLAWYTDVQVVQTNLNNEATTRVAADAQLVSGTLGMGPGDHQGLGLHFTSDGTPVGAYNDSSGTTQFPFMATQSWTAGQVANEAATRANADAQLVSGTYGTVTANGDKKGTGLHLNGGSRRASFVYAGGSGDLAWYTDVSNLANKTSAGTGSNNGFNYSWLIVNGVMTLSFTFENDNTGSAQTINFPKAFGGTATSVVVISMTKDNDVWVWNFGSTSFQMQTPNGGTNTFSCIAMGAAP